MPAKAADGNHDAKRAALDLDLLLISGAPLNHAGRNSTGIWGVNRQGCRFSRPAPWMARGGGPPNHWRITGTPSPSEVPSGGARALLVTFGWAGIPGSFPKVTRCKSQPFQGLFVLAALIIRSVETCAFTAVPLTHVLGLGTLGPRGLFATCLGWIFLASANKC